jgi:hypothetical protein
MRTRLGLLACVALSCGVLVLALGGGAAVARTVKSANLVKNGGAELGQAAANAGQIFAPKAWTTTGEFTQILYGASGGFPTAADSKAIRGGKAFFAGGNVALSTATQTDSVPTSWLSQVQRGRVKAVLSARLGGYGSQQDNATIVAHFLDSGGVELKTLQIGPVTVSARSGLTKLLPRTATVAVPTQTHGITIVITSTRVDGQYNDAYVDIVSLVLKR